MRTLFLTNPYLRGTDVRVAQHLLFTHKHLPAGSDDGQFGPQTGAACEHAKRYEFGYPETQIRATYGEKLNGYLTGEAKPPPSWIARANRRRAEQNSEGEMRKRIVAYCKWGIENEPAIHYEQFRPMEMADLKHLPARKDCSEFATDAYKFAGAPDPNGNEYNGYGYTGTLLAHMKVITRSMLQPGDLIVFGPGTGHHVVIATEGGYDPMTASHGMERGPLAIRLSDEMRYQPSPTICLTLPAWK